MELQSFEKPYGTLLNSANWVTGGPICYTDYYVIENPTVELAAKASQMSRIQEKNYRSCRAGA